MAVTNKMKTNLTFKFLFCISVLLPIASGAQSILFDFDNAPVYTPLPISQTVSGITAHFSATGQGYSIQSVSTATVVPVGFTGNFIFPSSINLSDLNISFDQTLTDFSIWYSCQELACDDAATMRVTAYMNGIYVGTNTKVATNPGTWPVDTLSCSFVQGFDSVVVHYNSHPPTCQDYGVIFIADNMRVTVYNATAIEVSERILKELNIPNPFSGQLTFAFTDNEPTTVLLYDFLGQQVLRQTFSNSNTINTEQLANGIYFYELRNSKGTLKTGKVVKQ